MNLLIETDHLSKVYGTKTAINNCTLSLPKKRVIGLVGPNGAGKTTLLNLFTGLISPSSGSVCVLGFDPVRDSIDLLPKIGFVSQDRPLFTSFTVSEMLKFGKTFNPFFDGAYALSYLEQLNIPTDKKVRELSGGMKAQISIILAISKHPGLLIMDEPFSSLDPIARNQLLKLVSRVTTEDESSVLISSHDIGELEKICDTLVLVNLGRVLLCGDIEELLMIHKWVDLSPEKAEIASKSMSIISVEKARRVHRLLVRFNRLDEYFQLHEQGEEANLDELILAYLALNQHEVESLNTKLSMREVIP